MKNVEDLPAGPELDMLVAEEIFDAIPLSDPEFEVFKAAYMLARGPHDAQAVARPVKIPLDEPNFYTRLNFCLDWPKNCSAPEWEGAAVVRKMRAKGWKFTLTDDVSEKRTHASFFKMLPRGAGAISDGSYGATDALAICYAAIKAMRKYKQALANSIANTL